EGRLGSVALLKGKVKIDVNMPAAFLGMIDPLGNMAQIINGPFLPFFACSIDVSKLTLLVVPQVGLPYETEIGVKLEPGRINTFEANIAIPAPAVDPNAAPSLESARLEFRDFPSGKAPAVVLTGRFTAQNAGDPSNLGGQIADLKVEFVAGGK